MKKFEPKQHQFFNKLAVVSNKPDPGIQLLPFIAPKLESSVSL